MSPAHAMEVTAAHVFGTCKALMRTLFGEIHGRRK